MNRRHVLLFIAALAFVPAAFAKGPPWISIEYPANPFEPTTRGAFLAVHAFHHGTPLSLPVSGTAEGVVNGERKSIKLDFQRTNRPGVYALRNQWGEQGRWVLVITVRQGEGDDLAQALVKIGSDGQVASVKVPTRAGREGSFPRRATAAEIEAAITN